MTSFKVNLTVAALGLFAVYGCKKKDEAAAVSEQTPATSAAAESSAKTPEQKLAEEVEQLAGQLDMPEDFISQAEQEINDDNLESELAKLEKEVEAEAKASGITLPDPTKLKPQATPGVTKPPVPVNKAPATNH